MLPDNFDLEEFERDVSLYHSLIPINIALSKLSELIDSTMIAVGSDAYNSALDVYAFAKMTDGVSGLEDLRSTLSSRFRKGGSRNNQEPELEPAAG